MKGPPIDQVVYSCMFPRPKPTDPQNFQSLLQRSLVPEVRLETQAYYGHLSSQEAKYPGLDYAHKPHRLRLSRYPWHRRLFRAFDNLGLTKGEIAGLTKWEGTRWAKERFEREQGIVIRDTTVDEIGEWVEHDQRPAAVENAQSPTTGDMGYLVEEHTEEIEDDEEPNSAEDSPQDPEDDDLESDTEIQSVGVELNARLRAAAAQREAGDATATMDEAWEKWFLERMESGDGETSSPPPLIPAPYDIQPTLSPNAHILGTRPAPATSQQQALENTAMFTRWLNAGRANQWHTIPTMVHPFVRQELENITRLSHRNSPTSITSPYNTLSHTSSPGPLSSGRLPSIHDLVPASHIAQQQQQGYINGFHPSMVANGSAMGNVNGMPYAYLPGTRNQHGTRQSLMASAQAPPFRGSLTRHRRTLFGRDGQFHGQSTN